jgi:hypothetical protein
VGPAVHGGTREVRSSAAPPRWRLPALAENFTDKEKAAANLVKEAGRDGVHSAPVEHTRELN